MDWLDHGLDGDEPNIDSLFSLSRPYEILEEDLPQFDGYLCVESSLQPPPSPATPPPLGHRPSLGPAPSLGHQTPLGPPPSLEQTPFPATPPSFGTLQSLVTTLSFGFHTRPTALPSTSTWLEDLDELGDDLFPLTIAQVDASPIGDPSPSTIAQVDASPIGKLPPLTIAQVDEPSCCNTKCTGSKHRLVQWTKVKLYTSLDGPAVFDKDGQIVKLLACRSCYCVQTPSRKYGRLCLVGGKPEIVRFPNRVPNTTVPKTTIPKTTVRKKRKAKPAKNNIKRQKIDDVGQGNVFLLGRPEHNILIKPSSLLSYGNEIKTQPRDGLYLTQTLGEHNIIGRYGGNDPVIIAYKDITSFEYLVLYRVNQINQYVDGKDHFTGKINHQWNEGANVRLTDDGYVQLLHTVHVAFGESVELFVDYGDSYWTNHFFDVDLMEQTPEQQQVYRTSCRIIIPNRTIDLNESELKYHQYWWNNPGTQRVTYSMSSSNTLSMY
jgi:uncharacterized protein YneR